MTLETPPEAQQLLQGLLKCRDCGIHMITVADTDGRPTHYACPTTAPYRNWKSKSWTNSS